MKMKTRTLYSLLLPLLLTAACEDAGLQPVSGEERGTRLHIQVRNVDTEALQVLVFDARAPKAIDAYYPAGSGEGGFETGTGSKIVACVVNGPDLSAVADFAGLTGWHYIPGEADDPASRPLSFCYEETRISRTTTSLSLDADLQIGRVALLGVSNRLEGHQTIESLHVYLANAAGDNLLGLDYLPTAVRLHPDGSTAPGTSASWTDQSLGALAYGAAHTGPYYLYSCPTPPSWVPWLILSARISGTDWYYSIPLARIEKGISQEVSVTLRTLGEDVPCIENEPGTYDLVHSPSAWVAISSQEQI